MHSVTVQLTFKIQLPWKMESHIRLAISLYPVVTLFASSVLAPDNLQSNGKTVSIFRVYRENPFM